MALHSCEVSTTDPFFDEAGPQRPGEGRPRFHPLHRSHAVALDIRLPHLRNVHQLFVLGKERSADGPFLGSRETDALSGTPGPYRWLSYGEVGERASRCGSGLARLGVRFGDCVAYCTRNRAEAYIARLSGHEYGHVQVPLHPASSADEIAAMLSNCSARVIVTESALLEKIIAVSRSTGGLDIAIDIDIVVLLDVEVDDRPDLRLQAEHAGLRLYGFTAVCRLGSHPLVPPERTPMPDDLAVIIHTSATTGPAKAVQLTHGSFLFQYAQLEVMQTAEYATGLIALHSREPGAANVFLSFMPMSHIYDQGTSLMCAAYGGRIGFARLAGGDPQALFEDIQQLQPTSFAGVPRLFNRLHDSVWAAVRARGGVGRRLFELAYATKLAAIRAAQPAGSGAGLTHWLWDRLVFNAIRRQFGSRLRLFVSGAAPITADVKDFMRVAFSVPVAESYSQTETCVGVTMTVAHDTDSGHVGGPLPGMLVKLVDVPEMGYCSADTPHPRGEICVKSRGSFAGYRNSAAKTAAAIDADGYVHTGDIGMWDAQGRLVIIDRASNMVKLAQGEWVRLGHVENVLQNHPLVAQAFVHAAPTQSFPVAVVVLDELPLRQCVREHAQLSHLADAQFESLCADALLAKHIAHILGSWCRQSELRGYEIPRSVHLESVAFSADNGLLTHSMKLKRVVARDRYRVILAGLYDAASPAHASRL